MEVFEMAAAYYPRLWDKPRLEALVKAGRLTEEEYREIVGEDKASDLFLKGARS